MKIPPPTLRLLKIIGVTFVLGLFINYRMGQAGDWLPPLPENVSAGAWESTDAPVPAQILDILGDPQAESRNYTNRFGEWVSVSAIAAKSFDAYHDPTVCSTGQGFYLKAETRPLIAGPGTPVRAMLLRNTGTDTNAIEYYWLQNDDGSTETEARMGTYRDLSSRFSTGFGTVVRGHKTILVRVFAMVPHDDKNGEQTHRNIEQISEAVYHGLNAKNEAGKNKS